MILKVPAGTVVKDAETGKVILDMANRTFLMRYIFDTFKDFVYFQKAATYKHQRFLL